MIKSVIRSSRVLSDDLLITGIDLFNTKVSHLANVSGSTKKISKQSNQVTTVPQINEFDDSLERFVSLIMQNGNKNRARLVVDEVLITLHQLMKQQQDKKNIHDISSSLAVLDNQNNLDESKDHGETGTRVVFLRALDRIRPRIEVRKVRIAGRTYQVPAAIPFQRSNHIAVKWLVNAAIKRQTSRSMISRTRFAVPGSKVLTKYSFSQYLALELWDALHYQGLARQQRHELHQLALANRAYYHYRWWVK